MNPVMETILTRRSVRSYTRRQIPPEDLDAILSAGSYAPSAMGRQTWRFTAIQAPEILKKVNETIRQTLLSIPIVEETHPYLIRLIQKAADENAEFLYGAPTYIIVSNQKDNANAMADCALAIGNMMLAAHSLGIGSCWLNQLPGLTEQTLVRDLLNELAIPEDHNVYGSLVLGYAAGEPKPADPRKDVIRIFR
ncbi:MAG TPA: nitroreductase family protein [Firmicutes bacterium]|jgi:nitroreductase|nr:nitroreductase family protein [Bacillota bacterium]